MPNKTSVQRSLGRAELGQPADKARKPTSGNPHKPRPDQTKQDTVGYHNTSHHIQQANRRRRIRVDQGLLDTINNAIKAAALGEDFRYGSVADFIRDALTDYQNGMKLTATVQAGHRKDTSIMLDENLGAFWDALPARQRPDILERILRTKLERGSTTV